MAEKRMFAKTIIDSDAFLDMPLSSQALYFHLSMRADDEGFINNPKKIQRMIGASDDDMKMLIAKNFIISFESGVIVIKHWKIHNYIRNDRLMHTAYQDERSLLEIKENGAYTLCDELKEIEKSVKCQSSVSQMSVKCQSNVSIDKNSIDKNSIDKDSIDKDKKGGVGGNKFFDNKELNSAFVDFISMRKKIKKPLTNNALTRAKNKLQKLSKGDENLMIAILNQSVDHCWQDLYELKEEVSDNGNKNNTTKHEYTDEELDRFEQLL